jgi:hypothetical protein
MQNEERDIFHALNLLPILTVQDKNTLRQELLLLTEHPR